MPDRTKATRTGKPSRKAAAAAPADLAREAGAVQEATPEAIAEVPPPPPVITVYGDFVDQVTAIHSSLMSPVFGMGRIDETSVLVPYVEVKLGGAPREDGTTDALFKCITTFENAAFLLSDLASDFAFTCDQLGEISKGGLQPEPQRMADALRSLDRARLELRKASEAIRSLTEKPDVA